MPARTELLLLETKTAQTSDLLTFGGSQQIMILCTQPDGDVLSDSNKTAFLLHL